MKRDNNKTRKKITRLLNKIEKVYPRQFQWFQLKTTMKFSCTS